jgi:type I restriction enzyme S subunit
MKLKPYPSYKDSGIQWIGEIPEDWKNERFKIRYRTKKGKIPDNLDELNSDGYLPYLSMEYLRGKEENVQFSNDPKALKVYDGDLLLLWDGSNAGEFIPSKKGYLSSTMVKLIIDRMDGKYSWFLCFAFEPMLKDLTIGMGIPHVNGDVLDNIRIPIIEINEQRKIASFLDFKTSEINKIIEKDKELIEILKEKRTSLINHVVTKGLDHNVKMKDSGIDWIRKIPEGWEIHKLKYKADINKQKLNDDTDPNLKIKYLDISNVDNQGNIHNIEEYFFEDAPSRARRIPKEKDTIISTVRTYLKAVAYLEKIPENFIVSTGFAVLESHTDILSKYNYYFVTSEKFIQAVIAVSKGVAYPAINPPELGQLYFLKPSKPEQFQIVQYLDKATSKIDQTITKIEEKITLMEAYKKSLIHHVVTGKVDVREVAI